MTTGTGAQTPLIFGAILIGLSIPVQMAFNAQLTRASDSPMAAALLINVVSVMVLMPLLVLPNTWPGWSAFSSAPPTAWLGGLLAAGYTIGIVLVAPRLGVGMTTGLILCGQVVAAMLLDHFGAFGNAQHGLNAWRVGGAAPMIAGVVAIRTH